MNRIASSIFIFSNIVIAGCNPSSEPAQEAHLQIPKTPDPVSMSMLLSIAYDAPALSRALTLHGEVDSKNWGNYIEKHITTLTEEIKDPVQLCDSINNLRDNNLISSNRYGKTEKICVELRRENDIIKAAEAKNREIDRERDRVKIEITEKERSLEKVIYKINRFKESHIYLTGIAIQEIDYDHYEIRVGGESGILIGSLSYNRLPSRFEFWVSRAGIRNVNLKNGRSIAVPAFEVADRSEFDLALLLYSSLEQDLHNMRREISRVVQYNFAPEAQKHVAELSQALLNTLSPDPTHQDTSSAAPQAHRVAIKQLPATQKNREPAQEDEALAEEYPEHGNAEDGEDEDADAIKTPTLTQQEREQLVKALLTGPPTSDFYWRLYERRVESLRFLGQTSQLEAYVTQLLAQHPTRSAWLLANLAHGCEDAGQEECAAKAHQLLMQAHDSPAQRIDAATFWLTTTPADLNRAEQLLASISTPPPKLSSQFALLQADINARRGERPQAVSILQSARTRANAKVIDAALERLNASPPQAIISPRRSPSRPFRTPRLWVGEVPTGAWSDDELATGLIFEAIIRARANDLRAAHGLLDAATLLKIKYDTTVELQLLRGKLMEQAGEHAAALNHYNALVQENPSDAKLLSRLAWTLLTTKSPELRDVKRAHKLAQQASESTARQDPSILDTLAEAEAQRGDFLAAQALVEECMRLEPSRDYYQRRFEDFEKKTTRHSPK